MFRFTVWPALLVVTAPALLAAQDSLGPAVLRYVSVRAPSVVLRHVKIVDGTGAPALEGQTIVISGQRIAAVARDGSIDEPPEARVLDLAGHTVIPGIVGVHDHTFYNTEERIVQLNFSAPRLYLASGVTTIRTAGSIEPYAEINLARAIDRGEEPGPRLISAGPQIGGERAALVQVRSRTPEDVRRTIAVWAAEGVRWIKLYTDISRAGLAAAVDEAHRRGLKVTAHLCAVTFREAAALGIDNLEHGLIVSSDFVADKVPDRCPPRPLESLEKLDVEGPAVGELIRSMIAGRVALTSTLAVFELFVPNRPPIDERTLAAMSLETRDEYLRSRAGYALAGGIPAAVFAKAMRFERRFASAGGLLAAGADPSGNGGALPGFADQRNYELLVEAGFSGTDAIAILTSHGAKLLGLDDEIGRIEPGKRADLVVIAGDPIARPADIRRVVTVFKGGVGYDSAALIAAVRGRVGID